MDETTRQIIQAIHDSPYQIVFVTAGAGTHALSNLLNVAGASRTVLEALVPYSESSFSEFLGQNPKQYVAQNTACLMAGRAYTRAHWLANESTPVIGLACTATIATDRPKRGEHRGFIAVRQPENMKSISVHLEKGARDRTGEEKIISKIILNMLAQACGLAFEWPLPFSQQDVIAETTYDYEAQVQSLLAGDYSFFSIEDNGRCHTSTIESTPQLLLSGSFNPLHDGHLEMAQMAAQQTGIPVNFELSAKNADKPALPKQIILRRLAQFAGRHTIYVSTAPTFIEKSRIYPGTSFLVGYDTAERILQPRFYQDDQALMVASLSEIKKSGCSFLVAGRTDANGRYHPLSDLTIPEGYQDLFQPLPFRKDISSTELRNTGQKGSR